MTGIDTKPNETVTEAIARAAIRAIPYERNDIAYTVPAVYSRPVWGEGNCKAWPGPGVLVAVYARDDPRHLTATRWLAAFRGILHTVEPVLAEAAYFLPARLRAAIAELVEERVIQLHHPDRGAYARIAALLRKYADIDPDWSDVSLIWLAETIA